MDISRHSLIFGLSYALDIAGKNNLSHSKSTAYLAVMVGRELGFHEGAELSLYYGALLHDIGASNEYVMFGHCEMGAAMLAKLPLPGDIPGLVRYHHELYNGSGPFKLAGRAIPKGAQIICLASAFDDQFGKAPKEFTHRLFVETQDFLARVERLFAPEIAAAFGDLVKREAFLLDYFNHETKYKLSETLVIHDTVRYGYEDVLPFALCFADIIDRRSPFTYAHSQGIARLARNAARILGYGSDTQNTMYIAGLLHDIGKLHVATEILHKNGPLTPEERFEINKHTYYTRKVLEQIPGFEEVVECAANHHEKLDGSGYPYHMAGGQLGKLERAMAICDIYQALTEERPYRVPMPVGQVWGILADMAGNGHLDKDLVQELKNGALQ